MRVGLLVFIITSLIYSESFALISHTEEPEKAVEPIEFSFEPSPKHFDHSQVSIDIEQLSSLLREQIPTLPHLSKVAFCLSADADFWLSVALSACSDLDENLFYTDYLGAGISVGLSVGSYVLLYFSDVNSDITGSYLGAQLAIALMFAGLNVGVFQKKMNRIATPSYLAIIGLKAGASFEFSAGQLRISQY